MTHHSLYQTENENSITSTCIDDGHDYRTKDIIHIVEGINTLGEYEYELNYDKENFKDQQEVKSHEF